MEDDPTGRRYEESMSRPFKNDVVQSVDGWKTLLRRPLSTHSASLSNSFIRTMFR